MFSVIFDLDEGGNGDAVFTSYKDALRQFDKLTKRPDVRAVELWEESDYEEWRLKEWARPE